MCDLNYLDYLSALKTKFLIFFFLIFFFALLLLTCLTCIYRCVCMCLNSNLSKKKLLSYINTQTKHSIIFFCEFTKSSLSLSVSPHILNFFFHSIHINILVGLVFLFHFIEQLTHFQYKILLIHIQCIYVL